MTEGLAGFPSNQILKKDYVVVPVVASRIMKDPKMTNHVIHVLNFGCSANQAIAEGLIGTLKQHQYQITESFEEANTVIVNTCVVKQNTEHRMKSLLLNLAFEKEVIITGCLPVVMRDWITENIPNAKVLFPEVAKDIILLLNNNYVPEVKYTDSDVWSQLYLKGRSQYNPVITIIEISRGCLGKCSFCIVQKAKGSLRSRAKENVLTEIKQALFSGSREIWLTSQDTGTYGIDLKPQVNLTDLIESINHFKQEFFVRIGMMTPYMVQNFLQPLIQNFQSPNIFKFLHLPIQSGSNKILRSMQRKEDMKYFIDLIAKLKKNIPDLVLATDIIVGFPGETEQDYQNTVDLLHKIQFEIVNISKYTDRPGTEASGLPEKVPTHIKSQRSRELSKICRNITQKKLEQWIDWEGKVIIDEYGTKKGQFLGRNTSYLPILFNNPNLSLGVIVRAKIIETKTIYLIGEVKE
ncbi:tRNA (N(6)-L-threonylcarbamoyladenosine(37)-C(2))-methylthiotransferase [Candidatus Hodarchaeum mangrovi]